MKSTISVIVPSLNEERNIEDTVNNILQAIGERFKDYELILFDDASTDRTGEIIDRLAAVNTKIRAVHNSPNQGFGYCFNKGVELARMEYVSVLPGDNEIDARSIEDMFSLVGSGDLLVPYTLNTEVRPRFRRIISSLYVFLMNLLFACELHYYTGPVIYRAAVLRNNRLDTKNFAFTTALLVRMIRKGVSFLETPILICPRPGKTKAFKIKNIFGVYWTIVKLFFEVRIFRRAEYSGTLRRVVRLNGAIIAN
jgi:dolichol-phosphate mannosyltransferase